MAASRSELPDAPLPELLQPLDAPLGRTPSTACIGSSSSGIGIGIGSAGSGAIAIEDPAAIEGAGTLSGVQDVALCANGDLVNVEATGLSPPELSAPSSDADNLLGDMRLGFSVPPSSNFSGVPRQELERWCAQVTSQLQTIMDTAAAKLGQCRTRMAEKDEVIRRLHWRLQNAEWLSSAGSSGIQCIQGSGPRTPGRRGGSGLRGGNAPTPVGGTTAADSAPLCSPSGGTSRSTRGSNATATAGGLSPGGGSGSVLHSTAATWGPGSKLSSALGSPGTPTGAGRGGSPQSGQQVNTRMQGQNQARSSRGAKENREQTHIAYLRQEVAQLRRQNCDLCNQVRSKEQQVDGLAAMVKELQVARTQQHLGLQRRQLHLRDDTLQAMQEELLLSRTTPAASAGASTPQHAEPSTVEETPIPNSARASIGSQSATSGRSRRTITSDPLAATMPHTARVTAPPAHAQAPRTSSGTTVASAQQAARAAAAEGGSGSGERGTSVARSQSAFARHKERLAARRGSAGAPPISSHVGLPAGAVHAAGLGSASPAQAAPSGNPSANSMFSPRARRPHAATVSSVASLPMSSGGAAPAGTAAGIAQAAQAAVQAQAAQAAAAAQAAVSARASSADGRGRTRGVAVRRGQQRR